MLDLLLGVSANAVLVTLATQSIAVLGAAPRPHRLLAIVFLFQLYAQAATLLLGLAGCLDTRGLLLVTLGAGALAVAGWRRRSRAERGPLAGDAAAAEAPVGRALRVGLLVLFGLVGLRVALDSFLLPPRLSDVLSYSLPKVASWLQSGGLGWTFQGAYRAYFPSGFELIQAWFALPAGNDGALALGGWPYGLLVGCACFVMARDAGASRSAAWLAAAGCVTVPAVFLGAANAKNDIAMAAHAAILFAALGACLAQRPHAPFLLRLALLAALQGPGVKPNFLFILPGLAVLVLAGWRRILPVLRVLRPAGGWGGFAALIGLSLLLGGYWYGLNWVALGSPLYPAVRQDGRFVLIPQAFEVAMLTGFSFRAMAEALRTLAVGRIWDPMCLNAELISIAGWGWFLGLLGPVAALTALLRQPALRWLLVGSAVSVASVYGFTLNDPWTCRYLMWLVPVLLACAGLLFDQLRHRGLRALLAGWLCLGGALNLLASWKGGYQASYYAEIMRSRRDGDSARTLAGPVHWEAVRWSAPDGRIVHDLGEYGRAAVLFAPDFSRHPVHVSTLGGWSGFAAAGVDRRDAVVLARAAPDAMLRGCGYRAVTQDSAGLTLWVPAARRGPP